MTKKQVNNLKLLSSNSIGGYGRCYDYKGRVLKIFRRKLDSSQIEKIEKNLKRKSEIIMYPTNKVFLLDKKLYFKGYICDKAPGVDLIKLITSIKNGKNDIMFDDFLSVYYDGFLPLLKKEDVLLKDTKLEHIFWENGLFLIDTDQYVDRPRSMLTNHKDALNVSELNYELNTFIMEFGTSALCWDLLHKIPKEQLQEESNIEKLIEEIRKLTNREVDSFNSLLNYKYRDNEEEPVLFDKEEYYMAKRQGCI